MERETVLTLLCTDLGFRKDTMPKEVETLVSHTLDAAAARLEKAGIVDPAATADGVDLWVMFAAYLYRHRKSSIPMPPSLRHALNDAKVSAATGEEAAL